MKAETTHRVGVPPLICQKVQTSDSARILVDLVVCRLCENNFTNVSHPLNCEGGSGDLSGLHMAPQANKLCKDPTKLTYAHYL